MEQHQRTYQQPGHEQFLVIQFCTFNNCNQQKRFICSACLAFKYHEHGNQNDNHVSLQDVLMQLKRFDQNQSQVKYNLQPLVNAFKHLEKLVDDIKQEIKQLLLQLTSFENQQTIRQYIIDLETNNVIDDSILFKFISENKKTSHYKNLPQLYYYFENLQISLYQFEKALNDIKNTQKNQPNANHETLKNEIQVNQEIPVNKQIQTNLTNQMSQLFQKSQEQQFNLQQQQGQLVQDIQAKQALLLSYQLQKAPLLYTHQQFQGVQANSAMQEKDISRNYQTIRYTVKEIDKTSKQFNASKISNNELYLAYGGSDAVLKVFNIKENKIIKQINLEKSILVCEFTNDSSKLFVGSQGFVYGFDSNNNFNMFYEQAIHQHWVSNIITIQNQFIITCSDKTIIKTDFINRQQIFKLVGHMNYVKSIDYNDNIIVSGSTDKSIKVWNCNNQTIIIDKQQSHNKDIVQIQLTNNKQNILSLDQGGQLFNWSIDMINKDLIKIQQFIDQNKIFNFYQVNQGQNLIVVCNKVVKILKNNGEVVAIINHDCLEYISDRDCKQLDNMKYIIIRASRTLCLVTTGES